MSLSSKTLDINHPAMPPTGELIEKKPDDVFNAELSAEMAKRTDKLLDNNIQMAVRLKQARDFMAWSHSHLRSVWLDWMEESDKAAQQMNMFRMAFDRETKSVIASGKDMKEFFNSTEYLAASSRLKEMIVMLDRFSQLKQDGTLDAFADFILKVSCNSPSKT